MLYYIHITRKKLLIDEKKTISRMYRFAISTRIVTILLYTHINKIFPTFYVSNSCYC